MPSPPLPLALQLGGGLVGSAELSLRSWPEVDIDLRDGHRRVHATLPSRLRDTGSSLTLSSYSPTTSGEIIGEVEVVMEGSRLKSVVRQTAS